MTRTVLTLTLAAGLLFAKGVTESIVIAGPDLSSPIRLTAGAANSFNVWSNGLIADTERPANPPEHARLYEVRFQTERRNPSTYIMRYAVTGDSKGYVYFPGKGEPEYRDNVWLILRGTEGKWFEATSTWRAVADPLLVKHLAKPEQK